MRFDLNDEQRAIKQAVHDLAAPYFERVTAAPGSAPLANEFWQKLATSGWLGLSVPERLGGQGAGLLELSLVIEELGYVLAPGGYFGNAAAGVTLGVIGGERHAGALRSIAAGERRGGFGQLLGDGSGLAVDADGAHLLVLL